MGSMQQGARDGGAAMPMDGRYAAKGRGQRRDYESAKRYNAKKEIEIFK